MILIALWLKSEHEYVPQHKLSPLSFAEITHGIWVTINMSWCAAASLHYPLGWFSLEVLQKAWTKDPAGSLPLQSKFSGAHNSSECFHVAAATGACFAFFRQQGKISGQ